MVDSNHIDREVHEIFKREDLFVKLNEIKAEMVHERTEH